MKIYLIALLCLCSFTSCYTSLNGSSIKGDGDVVSKEISVDDYSKIDAANTVNLIYESKTNVAPYLRLEIDKNLEEYIEIEVRNKELIVRNKENIQTNNFKVYTNSKELVQIKTSGASIVNIKGNIDCLNNFSLSSSGASKINSNDQIVSKKMSINCSGASNVSLSTSINTLNINCSGASTVNLRQVNVDNISSGISGSSSVTINGSATKLDIDASGASSFKGKNLSVDNVISKQSGTSNVQIFVNEKLKASTSGASHLKYKGSPKEIDKSTSGSSKITQITDGK